ncbi:TPA: ASCH domain-containing protein [Providencia alcalifaciens]
MKDRIKFNDAMLAAVMDGRKTQTRRPIEPQPKVTEEELRNLGAWQEGYTLSEQVCAAWRHGFVDVDCPYGEIGDIINIADKDGNIKGKIEITDVWLQQVQEISQGDALAEGFELTGWRPTYSDPDSGGETSTPYDKFADVWIDIYGEDSWNNNPWVWVIELKKVE